MRSTSNTKNRPGWRFWLASAAGFASFAFGCFDDPAAFDGVAFFELAVGLAPFSASFSHVCPPVVGCVVPGLVEPF